MKINDMIELMKQMKGNDITCLETEENGTRLRLERSGEANTAEQDRIRTEHQMAAAEIPTQSQKGSQADKFDDQEVIKAPVVGIFYAASSPESEPFVTIGATVQAGETVCIIEAMKLMNEVTSPYAGIVRAIFVSDGERVEYGQPMICVEPIQ